MADAIEHLRNLERTVADLIRLLVPHDFELLVDLIFTASGWRRIGVVGKTQKTIDIALELPSTGERAFVQVKSKTKQSELDQYLLLFEEMDDYGRMFLHITRLELRLNV